MSDAMRRDAARSLERRINSLSLELVALVQLERQIRALGDPVDSAWMVNQARSDVATALRLLQGLRDGMEDG